MLNKEIKKIVEGVLDVEGRRVRILKEEGLESEVMDELVWQAVFGEEEEKKQARWLIWEIGQELGVRPASINDFYMGVGKGKVKGEFTVPAVNLKGMAYDMARSLFEVAKEKKVGALIAELARSEMGYTDQPPEEYASVVLAGAIRSGFRGPVFIQGDHFQTKVEKAGVPAEGEVESIKRLILNSMKAGFYNIDIDTSTLVDLEKEDEKEQQEANVKYSLEFAKFVRENEPKEVTVSLGGEIGHIGGKNSTLEEFEAYIEGFEEGMDEKEVGMSKVSVQTGTSHGGVVLADGSLAEVNVDFSVLRDISKAAREKYGMGGAVQHGASTLPDEYFSQFPQAQALEVHLATGFQNILMDHEKFPKKLLDKIYKWLDENKIEEKKDDQTDAQFHYKLRKKGWGVFKRECWEIDEEIRGELRGALKKRFEFMLDALGVFESKSLVEGVVDAPESHKGLEDFGERERVEKVEGLAD